MVPGKKDPERITHRIIERSKPVNHNLMVESPISLNLVDLAIAGAIASAFADFVMHPIDTIKTRQQASKIALSITEACTKIYNCCGFTGFYAGVRPMVIGDGLAGAIKFATYEMGKGFFKKNIFERWIPCSNFLCGAIAMIACSFVLVPGELLKQKLQSGMASSLLGGITSIFAAEGICGFFQGYGATMLRDIPYTMLELGLYDSFKILFKRLEGTDKPSQRNELLAAGMSGALTGFSTTPLDVIKTRIMTTKIGEATPGFFRVISDILKEEGASGLFKGAAARVLWLVPFTMLYLPSYETSKRLLMQRKVKKMQTCNLSERAR